jgi:putative hemolysin
VLRMFGDKTSFTEARMSRDELQQLVVEAAKAGSVDTKSSEIAARALELEDVAVAEVMVRRENIIGIPRSATAADVQRILLESGHSRMPVYDDDPDRIEGYVVARDVLAVAWQDGLVVLADIVSPLIHVPLSMKVPAVLKQMQAKGVQIALVVDEHAGVAGLVTIEDLLEELVGDIRSEDEEPEQELTVEPDGSALVPGWVPIRRINRALHLDLPITRDSTTIAGLCLALALAIPAVGTRLRTRDGTTLEVVDASPRRVRMVRVVHTTRDRTNAGPGDDTRDGPEDNRLS